MRKGRIGEADEDSLENRTFDSRRKIAALDGMKSMEVFALVV